MDAYDCKQSGSSTYDFTEISSTGETAAAAFNTLVLKCDDVVVVQGKCQGGRFVRTEATIQNACVKE